MLFVFLSAAPCSLSSLLSWRSYRPSVALSSSFFFFSSRRRHTRCSRDWSSDVCSSDLASTLDFYAPLAGRHEPGHLLRVGRWLTLFWTAVLVTGAMAFRDQNTPVVQLALSIVSITYGGLLGTYLLGGLWPRARQRDVIARLLVGVAVMAPVVLGVPWRALPGLAWWWYVALGTGVTVLVGMAAPPMTKGDAIPTRTVTPVPSAT